MRWGKANRHDKERYGKVEKRPHMDYVDVSHNPRLKMVINLDGTLVLDEVLVAHPPP